MFIEVWKSNGVGPMYILKNSLAEYLAKGFTTENPKQRKKREKPESPPAPQPQRGGFDETGNKPIRKSQAS
jgi:hypothetical protein